MLLLTGTTHKLQVVTASTGAIDVNASFVDLVSSTVTPGSTNTAQITTATTTDVVAAPAASTQRNIRGLRIRNAHASSSMVVTVQHTDGTTTSTLIKTTLKFGESLTYEDGCGWMVMDAAGALKVNAATGRFLRTTLLTSGTSFTTGVDTNTIFVRLVGGGAGGAGCTSVAAAASAGGGGGAGSYAEKQFTVTPNTAYTYAIGTAGAGASGALGGNGGNTTFAVSGVTVTAPGGTGAPVATAATSLTAYVGGTGGVAATNGDVNASGEPGSPGVVLIVATPILVSGNGGSSQFGSGGKSISAVGNGNNATGFGAGGGGAATGASAVRTGGSGTAGCIVVDEYA
jgi:hypothetical protein